MATIFRAALMLGVLVGLPAAWIYYGPLPEKAQRAVDQFMATAKKSVGWDASNMATAEPAAASPFVVGDSRGGSAVPPTSHATPVAAPSTRATTAITLEQEIAPLLAQLRQLGASQYALEQWGRGGQYYRFYCEMPLAGADVTQQFEAIAAEPKATIEQVVSEVATWQLARREGGLVR